MTKTLPIEGKGQLVQFRFKYTVFHLNVFLEEVAMPVKFIEIIYLMFDSIL